MIDTINRKSSGQPADNMGHDGGPDIGADQAYPAVLVNALSTASSNNISDIFNAIHSIKNKNNMCKCNIVLRDCLLASITNQIPIKKCGHPRCATCPSLNCNSNFQSTVTGKNYKSSTPIFVNL